MIDIKRLEWDRGYWDEVAPEGANRYYDRPHYQCFLKHSSLDHMYHLSSGEWHPIPRCAIQSHLNSSFPRPDPRQVEWDEEGRAPVGWKGEANNGGKSEYFPVEVVAHHYKTGREILKTEGGSLHMLTEKPDCWVLRPIRTKQQREREELTEILQNGRLTLMSDQLADLILRSGWSKNDG